MKVTEDTKRVAQEIVDFFMENPGVHDQDIWFYASEYDSDVDSPEDVNICDTNMCIAGSAVYVTEGLKGLIDTAYHRDCDAPGFFDKGQEILGLDSEEAFVLFEDTMSNSTARDAVRAIAAGDEAKFHEVVGLDR